MHAMALTSSTSMHWTPESMRRLHALKSCEDLLAPTSCLDMIHCNPHAQASSALVLCTGMSQPALVAMLRSRARKSSTQTSHFRGVSLLKQTSKWHAQINVGGKQVRSCFTTEQALTSQSRHIMYFIDFMCVHRPTQLPDTVAQDCWLLDRPIDKREEQGNACAALLAAQMQNRRLVHHIELICLLKVDPNLLCAQALQRSVSEPQMVWGVGGECITHCLYHTTLQQA